VLQPSFSFPITLAARHLSILPQSSSSFAQATVPLTAMNSYGSLSVYNNATPASVALASGSTTNPLTSLCVQVSDSNKTTWVQFDFSPTLAKIPLYVFNNGLYVCIDFTTQSTGQGAGIYTMYVSLQDVAGVEYVKAGYSMTAQPAWAQVGFNTSTINTSPAQNATCVLNWPLSGANSQSVVYQQQSMTTAPFTGATA
jgi:hypothetical protein